MFTRILWTMLAVVGLAFGALGLLVLSLGALVGWSLLAVAVGVGVRQYLVKASTAQRFVVSTRSPAGNGVAAGVGVVVTVVVTAGMVTAIGAAGAMAVLLVVVVAWAGWRFWFSPVSRSARRWGERTDPRAAPELAPVVVVSSPEVKAVDLPTGELCVAWRRSYLELQRTVDEPARQRLVRLRREYLDELERRDRAGFARWLASGARAGSDPQRYLTASG